MTFTERAWRVTGLTPGEKLVLLELARYADRYEEINPGIQRLADETGMARSGVHKCLQKLRDLGLVTWTQGAGRATSTYKLTLLSSTEWTTTDSALSSTQWTTSEDSASLCSTEWTQLISYKAKSFGGSTTYYPSSAPSALGPETPVDETQVTEGVLSGVTRDGVPYSDFITVGYPKEKAVAAPGFEDRGADQEHVPLEGAALGRLPKRYVKTTPKQRPWTHVSLYRYFRRLAEEKAPDLTDQVPEFRVRGEFKLWISKGHSVETLRESIDRFFADSSHFLDLGRGRTIWERYRAYFVHNQASFKEDVSDVAEDY